MSTQTKIPKLKQVNNCKHIDSKCVIKAGVFQGWTREEIDTFVKSTTINSNRLNSRFKA